MSASSPAGSPLSVFMPSHHMRDATAGAASADLQLAASLEARGHRVTTYFYQDAYAGRGPQGAWRQLLFPWRVAHALWRGGHAYDVVDGTAGDLWLARLLFGRRKGTAWIVRTHGLEHHDVRQIEQSARLHRRRLGWTFPLYHSGVRLWEVTRDLRGADRVVFHNEADREYAITELGIPGERLHVQSLGTDIVPGADVRPDELWFRLLFAGSWIPRKGIDALVAAASTLLAEDERYRLTCIGTGAPADIVKRSFAEPIRARVDVVPHYSRSQLRLMLAEHGILVFPSRYEGFGLALLEAMAAGLVPVATETGIAARVVRDGETGCRVPPDAPDRIIEAVRRVSGNPIRARMLSRAATDAVRPFTWPSLAEARERLYREVLTR